MAPGRTVSFMKDRGRDLADRLVLLGTLGAIACGGASDPPERSGSTLARPDSVVFGSVSSREARPQVDGRNLTALVAGNTPFALDMFATLAPTAPDANVALGPYSISQAMAMLYAGARGLTADEMRAALHFEVDPISFHQTFNGLELELLSRDGDITLRNANQVWAQTGFTPLSPFLDILT